MKFKRFFVLFFTLEAQWVDALDIKQAMILAQAEQIKKGNDYEIARVFDENKEIIYQSKKVAKIK
jgi:hypothetical protein